MSALGSSIFSGLFGGPNQQTSNATLNNVINDWLRRGGKQKSGASWGPGGQDVISALNNIFSSTNTAIQKGTPFYESLIPSSPGALSPAAAAEKSAATDALLSSVGSSGVAGLGQLNREYGGRLPASMVQSGFGNLARAQAGGQTDIARQAVANNVNLGMQGVAGLGGLSSLAGNPAGGFGGFLSGADAGMFNSPGAINSVVNTGKNVAGAVAGGISGFGGLGGGGATSGTFGTSAPSFGAAGGYAGLGLPIPGTLQTNPSQLPNKLYAPQGT